jgi:hypothetical protein
VNGVGLLCPLNVFYYRRAEFAYQAAINALFSKIAQITDFMMTNSALNIESLQMNLFEAGHAELAREWNYKRLSSPFSRIYLIEQGEAVIRHSGREHRLQAGDLHLIPCHVTADYVCLKRHVQYFVGFTMKLMDATGIESVADLSWIDSGGAASSITGDIMTLTAAKNSQVLATLPSAVELATTNDYILVSFDVSIAGTTIADDGSALRIGFNNSAIPYGYSVSFESYGGASQAILGETDDTNLGKFDISAMGSSTHSISFMLTKTDSSTGLELVASGDLITEPGQLFWEEPDMVPLPSAC